MHPLFCGIHYYLRKVLKNFENCSQLDDPIGSTGWETGSAGSLSYVFRNCS